MSREQERGCERIAGGNRFAFATLVAQRARQLERGAPPRVVTETTKPVSVAIAEAARGAG